MIRLTTQTSSGSVEHYVAAQAILRVTEAGASSQWRGIRSIVRTSDGAVLECSETAKSIFEAIGRVGGI